MWFFLQQLYFPFEIEEKFNRASYINYARKITKRYWLKKKRQQRLADGFKHLLYSRSIVALLSGKLPFISPVYSGFGIDPTFRNDGVGCSNHPSGTISSPCPLKSFLASFRNNYRGHGNVAGREKSGTVSEKIILLARHFSRHLDKKPSSPRRSPTALVSCRGLT